MKIHAIKFNVINIVFFLFLTNAVLAKVNPQPGENLWRLTARIGECVDVTVSQNDAICSKLENISSKIDELEFVGSCDTLIFQNDIPYTIESPGLYCLAESVNFATGTAITIASDNVILDLNEKKIDGSAGGSIGIAVNSGLQNITIQNGMLCNMNDKGINADATNNITFISMSVLDSLIDMPSLIAPIAYLQINNVNVLNVGIFKEFPISSIVDSVSTDCTLSTITGININCATEVSLINCQVLGCLGDGFALQQSDNVTALSCNAEKNGGNGFVLDNVDTSCLKWCKANVNCFHGICDSACNGDNLYVGCIAKQNGIDGFNVAGGGKVMQKCIASQNTGDGFNLSTPLFNDANLDITFGVGGIVTTSFGSTPFAQRIAQQKDGKLVVVGTDGDDFAIGRYNTDGSLDASFGTSGIVITAFSGGLDAATGVAIQDNGKIVVGGVANFGSSDFAVARYNVDGSLDLSFGVSGKVTTAISGVNIASSIALQKDGKIVVVGLANAAIDAEFATVRYNTDGSLDTTFGIGGIVTTSFAAGKGSSRNDVAIQKDGKIVVVGGINDQDVDFVVVRYNTNGSLDESFGLGGIVTTTFEPNNNGNANAVVIQKDGKIVVAGQVEIIDEDIALARYNIDGTLDTSFNPTGSLPGTVVTDLASEEAGNAIALQKDGKIIVAGNSNSNFVVLRYRTDGLLDTTFNPTGSTPGTVITNIEGSDIGTTVVIQQNGKIVVAGTANIGEGNEWAIARYIVLKQGVAIQNCVAEENGQNGFDITGSAYLVRSSSAIHNALNGFSLESLTDGCQLLDNQALQNANDGFLLASLTDSCQLISNSALQNTNVGIENLGSLNQIFNSRAYGNTSADYIGISLDANPPLVTTGFWTNVRGV